VLLPNLFGRYSHLLPDSTFPLLRAKEPQATANGFFFAESAITVPEAEKISSGRKRCMICRKALPPGVMAVSAHDPDRRRGERERELHSERELGGGSQTRINDDDAEAFLLLCSPTDLPDTPRLVNYIPPRLPMNAATALLSSNGPERLREHHRLRLKTWLHLVAR